MADELSFVAFTYDRREKDSSIPFWEVGMPRDMPVAIHWNPRIGCSAEQYAMGSVSLVDSPFIPWHDINIREVIVESRKVYEILSRIVPSGWDGVVRINPPVPEDFSHFAEDNEKKSGWWDHKTIIAFNGPEGLGLAVGIAAQIPESICVGNPTSDMLASADNVIYTYRSTCTDAYLAFAVNSGCKILASDAGASEEYLARFATPGTWHVCKSWTAERWVQMYRHLIGEESNIKQTAQVDLSPYLATEARR